MTYWLIPFTLPMWVQGHLVAALAYCFGLWDVARYRRGILVCEWRQWWAQRWRFTTTIGYAMGSEWGGPSQRVWEHELVHVWQAEDLCVLGAAVGGVVAVFNPWLGLGLWCSSGPLWQVFNFITAIPRFRRMGRQISLKGWEIMYYGAEHERSAYAQTGGERPF